MANRKSRGPARKQPARQRAEARREAEVTHDIDRGHQGSDEAALELHEVERENGGELEWTRPSSLDAPPARPGYVQRWIRTELGNAFDHRNYQKAMREGWRPRQAESVPRGYEPPVVPEGRLQGVIGAEGLILCEMPERVARQRDRHYAKRAARLMQSVDEDLLKVQRPGEPIRVDRKERSEVGRRPVVAGDG